MCVSQLDQTVFALSFYKRRCLALRYQSRLQVLTGLICVASPSCEAGDQIPLCVVYRPACHPLKAAALIVVKRHSISAGHFRQSYQEEEREEEKKNSATLCLSFKWESFLVHPCWKPLAASIFLHTYHRPVLIPQRDERALSVHPHTCHWQLNEIFICEI